jgi:hypothetical protein
LLVTYHSVTLENAAMSQYEGQKKDPVVILDPDAFRGIKPGPTTSNLITATHRQDLNYISQDP